MNRNQTIAVILVVLGVLMASTAQLNDLLGAGPAKYVVSVAGLLNSILAGVLGVMTGQAATIKDLSNTTGVEPIRINAQANPTLAAVALDPGVPNVGPAANAQSKLVEIAKG